MKIGEILATKYVHPDIEKNLKKWRREPRVLLEWATIRQWPILTE